MKTINLEFTPDGEVRIEANGFKGPDCEKATKFLEEALASKEAKKKGRKPDFYTTTSTNQRTTT